MRSDVATARRRAGGYDPSTAVALRPAVVLETPVTALFALSAERNDPETRDGPAAVVEAAGP